MKRLGVVILLASLLALVSCSRKTSSTGGETAGLHPQLLVTSLPAGVEGVELARTGLHVIKGYQFVKDSDSTFAIARMSDGQHVTSGGCGCAVTGGCEPEMTDGGIIICKANDCTDCGLRLTVAGANTMIFKY